MKFVTVLTTTLLLVASTAALSATPQRYERRIAHDLGATANPCHSTTKPFTVSIPDSQYLDMSYKGVLSGIRVVEIAHRNSPSRAYDFAFSANGSALTFKVYAEGGGRSGPANTCIGPNHGEEYVDIYAEYVRPAQG